MARRSGVSPKTASNVLNSTGRFSDAAGQRVRAAARELDYVPNLSARGLRNGRSGLVCLALPHLGTAYSAELGREFVLAAARRGWSVQVEETGRVASRELELMSRARRHLIDGLIMNPTMASDAAAHPVAPLPPLVLIGEVQQSLVDHVWVDNLGAARAVVQHLLELGHHRIAVLGEQDSETSRVRVAGYEVAMAAAGIMPTPDLRIANAEWTAAGAAAAVDAHLDLFDPPQAVFCLTDTQALGAVHALWRRGLRVPGDVAVAGFDAIEDSRWTLPPLTTVGVDKQQLAESALSLLAERVAGYRGPPRVTTVPHRLLVRASTAAAWTG